VQLDCLFDWAYYSCGDSDFSFLRKREETMKGKRRRKMSGRGRGREFPLLSDSSPTPHETASFRLTGK
tara:strand:+ start:478 stop:681 length:204 start_codon:yes stop_codon:yes gene_type:complete